jgi:hypothetical protein
MYNLHGHRGSTYSPFDYGGEMSDLLTQVAASGADPSGRAMSILVAPNIADFAWTPELVWNSGLVDKFANNLAYLAVEKCVCIYGVGWD